MIENPFLLLDAIGIACAVRVFAAWIRQQGWNPLKWTGVATHVLDCTFCLPFWCSIPVMILTGLPVYHALGVGAIGYAYFQTFLPTAEPEPHDPDAEAPWEARDVLADPAKAEWNLTSKSTTDGKVLHVARPTAPSTSTFIDDDAYLEYVNKE